MKRVAVVTGASSGIGKAIAQYYHNEGFFVVGINRDSVDLDTSPVDRNWCFDLANKANIVSIGIELEDQLERTDVLVNNHSLKQIRTACKVSTFIFSQTLSNKCKISSFFLKSLSGFFSAMIVV